MPEKQDWSDWDIERRKFADRDTEGFTKDLSALEAHIKKLAEVCPKDKAGWPVGLALIHIGRRQKEYNCFKGYLHLFKS